MFLLLAITTALYSCGRDPVAPATNEPRVSVNNVTLFEGNDSTKFPFKVTLSKATDKEVTVSFTTANKSALSGRDYSAKSGTVTFPANSLEQTIEITVLGDTIKQADKDFEFVLSNATNAVLGTDRGLGTIRNDDTAIFIPAGGYTTPLNYAGYEQLWSDEFSGTQIDNSLWGYDIGGGGWGNNELEYYTDSPKNSYVSSGNLVIEARKESFLGREYTSARIISKGKKDFTFGRVDIRAKLPKGQGIWPALWMLGKKIDQTNWPNCGEIDIMELLGHEPSKIYGTVHYGPIGSSTSTTKTSNYKLPSGDFSDSYHVFSLNWSQDNMEVLIDDVSMLKTDRTQIGAIYPFNEPFFMLFNVAVGGNWPGGPDISTVFPQQMLVDYIRVFKKL